MRFYFVLLLIFFACTPKKEIMKKKMGGTKQEKIKNKKEKGENCYGVNELFKIGRGDNEKNNEVLYVIGDLQGDLSPFFRFIQDKDREKVKMILLGNYIVSKRKSIEESKKDLLIFKEFLKEHRNIIALMGDQEMEALNGVFHKGHGEEKEYSDFLKSLLEEELIFPSYFFNGIFYSHSYLTNDDYENLRKRGMKEFDPLELNKIIKDLILSKDVSNTWLSSRSMGLSLKKPCNFFFSQKCKVPDNEYEFPMIISHLKSSKGEALFSSSRALNLKSFYDQRRKEFSYLKIDYKDYYFCTIVAQ